LLQSEIEKLHPDWHVIFYGENVDEVINCASCGKEVKYGETYTSLEQFIDDGSFGLSVCADCYAKEYARMKAKEAKE